MARKEQIEHARQLRNELGDLQTEITQKWVEQSLPSEWNFLDDEEPLARPRERVTLRLDAEMLRWFRKLGPGYQARLNLVLLIYWRALLSGAIAKNWQDQSRYDRVITAMQSRYAEKEEVLRKVGKEG